MRVDYTREVPRFLENSDISETDFSLDDTAALYTKAAARTVRVFPVLQQAIEAAGANQRQPKPKPAAEEGKGGARRNSGSGRAAREARAATQPAVGAGRGAAAVC